MNVFTTIKELKTEVKKVKEENKKYNDTHVKTYLNMVCDQIKNLESDLSEILDLEKSFWNNDYKESMRSDVNWCYGHLADCYFALYIGSYTEDSKRFEAEEARLKAIKY
jgi:hypothetical protein